MSFKTPNIILIPDPVGLDELIQDIQQDFQANLPWLQYAFGRARPHNDDGVIEPRVYYSQTTSTKEGEYRDVWPNDYWQSHCFFLSEGPQNYIDYINIPKATNIWNRPISIVFWVNLHRIDSTRNTSTTEPLVLDVLNRLKNFEHIEVTSVVDNSAELVFQGFSIQNTDSKNFAYPFVGFKIFANASGYEPCLDSIIIPAPTLLIATTLSSTEIQLNWTDNGGGIYPFQIERSLSIAGPYTLIDTTAAGDTTYNDNNGGSGLDPSTEYFYRVRATDGSNFSAYSNIDSATTDSVTVLWDISDLLIVEEWWDASPKDWKTGNAQNFIFTRNGNGIDVTDWEGRINTLSMAQSVIAEQPTFSGGILSFNSDRLITSAFSSAISQPYTIVLVAQVTTGGTSRNLTDGIVSTNRAVIQYQNLNWVLFSGSSISFASSDLNLHVLIAEYNGTSSRLYIDGTLLGTGNAGTNSLTGLTLGTRFDGLLPLIGDAYQKALIPEVMSTDNRQRTEGMLAHMVADTDYYNNPAILNALPANHPYKNSPPTV